MILAHQFLAGILADGAEFLVDVGDRAQHVGRCHNGVLIQGELLVGQFFERSLAGGQAFFQCFLRQRPLGNLGLQFRCALRYAPL